jgi:propionyl-CoA synthetase
MAVDAARRSNLEPEDGMLTAEGIEAFARVLDGSWPEIVVSTRDLARIIEENKAITVSGKLDQLNDERTAQPAHARPNIDTPYVAPQTETERIIAQIWQQLLGIEKIGVDDNFFELGGHSLLLPRLLQRIRNAIGVNLSIATVFESPTAASLAARIDDARPALMITADGGSRMGKAVLYKALVDESLKVAKHPPRKVLIFRRGLDANMPTVPGRDVDWTALAKEHAGAGIPCAWLEANEPSYILFTSGTTGRPKGVQRDVGGHAVALAASMKHIFCGEAGETMFTTSDIGWVVGHSYIIYAPLLAGMTTIMYEGVPIRPDAGVWWKIVQDHKVSVMFSAPTAIRVLKKHDVSFIRKHDLASLKHLFLAGEPLDEPTHRWITESLGRPVIDHYWQTETGWPLLSTHPGVEQTPLKMGSPSFPVYGYDVRLLHEQTGKPVADGEKGVVAIAPPLPPGCMSTVWGDDERFVKTYFSDFKGQRIYSTFDWGIRDKDGYYFILGRTDDVINVAGHRLGTREIEEAVSMHPNVAECAVVGVADALKGQMPLAFAVLKDSGKRTSAEEVMQTVDRQLGAIARPKAVHFVTALPKTRSGKTLRRAIQALAEGRDPGDLTTIEDPNALSQIKEALHS